MNEAQEELLSKLATRGKYLVVRDKAALDRLLALIPDAASQAPVMFNSKLDADKAYWIDESAIKVRPLGLGGVP